MNPATTGGSRVAYDDEQPMNGISTLNGGLCGYPVLLKLITSFYADVRQHVVSGPIFNAHIHDRPTYLAKITEFWALQTGGNSKYRDGFGAAHLRLGIQPEHVQHWLALSV